MARVKVVSMNWQELQGRKWDFADDCAGAGSDRP